MDIDYLFNHQHGLPDDCMSVADARAVMARHLAGDSVGAQLVEARRVLRKNKIFPIGAKHERAREDLFADFHAQKYAKTEELPFTPYVERRTPVQWASALVDNMARYATDVAQSAAESEQIVHALTAQHWDVERADIVRDTIRELAATIGGTFSAQSGGARAASSDAASRALDLLERHQKEIVHAELGEEGLQRYAAAEEDGIIELVAQIIVGSFRPAPDDEFSVGAPMGAGGEKKTRKKDLRLERIEQAESLGINITSRQQMVEAIDMMAGLAQQAADKAPEPSMWRKLLRSVLSKLGISSRWLDVEEVIKHDVKPASLSSEAVDDALKQPLSIFGLLKYFIGLALTAGSILTVYYYSKSYFDLGKDFDFIGKELGEMGSNLAAVQNATGDVQQLVEDTYKSQVALQLELETPMTVLEATQYIGKHMGADAVGADNSEPAIAYFASLRETVTVAATDAAANADRLIAENAARMGPGEAVGLMGRNVEVLASNKENIAESMALYEEGLAERNVAVVISSVDQIMSYYLGSAGGRLARSMAANTQHLLRVFKTLTDQLPAIQKEIQAALGRTKDMLGSLTDVKDKWEATKQQAPLYAAMMNFIAQRDLSETWLIGGLLPRGPLGLSFVGMFEALGFHALRDVESIIFRLLDGLAKVGQTTGSLLAITDNIVKQLAYAFGSLVLTVLNNQFVGIVAVYLGWGTTVAWRGLASLAKKGTAILFDRIFGDNCNVAGASAAAIQRCREKNARRFETYVGFLFNIFDDTMDTFGGAFRTPGLSVQTVGTLRAGYMLYNLMTTAWPLLATATTALVPLAASALSVVWLPAEGLWTFGGIAALVVAYVVRMRGRSVLKQLVSVFINHPYLSTAGVVGVQILLYATRYVLGATEYVASVVPSVDEKADKILEAGGIANVVKAYGSVVGDTGVRKYMDAFKSAQVTST